MDGCRDAEVNGRERWIRVWEGACFESASGDVLIENGGAGADLGIVGVECILMEDLVARKCGCGAAWRWGYEWFLLEGGMLRLGEGWVGRHERGDVRHAVRTN